MEILQQLHNINWYKPITPETEYIVWYASLAFQKVGLFISEEKFFAICQMIQKAYNYQYGINVPIAQLIMAAYDLYVANQEITPMKLIKGAKQHMKLSMKKLKGARI